MHINHVEAAYRAVSMLPAIDCMNNASLELQTRSLIYVVGALVACPMYEKHVAAEAGHVANVIYDTKNTEQMCVANVMHMMLKNVRWNSTLCSDDAPVTMHNQSISVVFISKNLHRNPVCMGYFALMQRLGVKAITVLSQEDFPAFDQQWSDSLQEGNGITDEELRIIDKIAPHANPPEIANAFGATLKILAWRFTPQESEAVVDTEFHRIVDRMKVTMIRNRGGLSKSLSLGAASGASAEASIPQDKSESLSLGAPSGAEARITQEKKRNSRVMDLSSSPTGSASLRPP